MEPDVVFWIITFVFCATVFGLLVGFLLSFRKRVLAFEARMPKE